ncbi:MAG TPA: hypothetical protein VFM05_11705, partial [Candidatus Saccharimonadales bacterium]|nr:hypothetical protein [Candidatus Saccharimonadales bacterium]
TKRIIKGRHIRVSGKHLSTYVRGGHQFRYNARNLTTEERLEKWFGLASRKQPVPHKELIKKQAEQPLALRGWARKRAMLPTQTSLF